MAGPLVKPKTDQFSKAGIPKYVHSPEVRLSTFPTLFEFFKEKRYVGDENGATGLFIHPTTPSGEGINNSRKALHLAARSVVLVGKRTHVTNLIDIHRTLVKDDGYGSLYTDCLFVDGFFRSWTSAPILTPYDTDMVAHFLMSRISEGLMTSFQSDVANTQCASWWPKYLLDGLAEHCESIGVVNV